MSDTRMYSCDFDGLLCDDAWPEIAMKEEVLNVRHTSDKIPS